MKLRSEAHLHVTYPFGLVILRQLGSDPLQSTFTLQHADRIAEALKVIDQAIVRWLKYSLLTP